MGCRLWGCTESDMTEETKLSSTPLQVRKPEYLSLGPVSLAAGSSNSLARLHLLLGPAENRR